MALNRRLLESFNHFFSPRLWHGFRLLAVDGSTARVPNTADVIAIFGEPPTGASTLLARFSRSYDVSNHRVIEANFESRQVGERVLAGKHLAATQGQDLILYDRGYPTFWLFALHAQEHRHFCARMPLGFSTEVSRFLASGQKSEVVLAKFPGPSILSTLWVAARSDPPTPDPRPTQERQNRGPRHFITR